MTIKSILSPEHVLHHPPVDDKYQAIAALIAVVSEWDEATRDLVHRAVLEREEVMSTGVGNGIAIPHAKVPVLEQSVMCAALLEKPVEFGSYDGKPVDLFFLVVGPDSQQSRHLKTLSRLSRILANTRFQQRLRQAEDPETFSELMKAEEAAHE